MADLLITLDQAKRHLRLDTANVGSPVGSPPIETDTEIDLTLKMVQATAIVLDYIADTTDVDWTAEIASWTADDPPGSGLQAVPPIVQAAILLVLLDLWRFRGDDPHGVTPAREHGFLTPQVVAILHRYRRPAVS